MPRLITTKIIIDEYSATLTKIFISRLKGTRQETGLTSEAKEGRFLPSGKIGHMDEGVVEGGVDVGDAEDLLSFADLRTEGDLDLLNLLLLSLAGGHSVATFSKNEAFEKFLLSVHAGNVIEKEVVKRNIA